MTNRGSVLTISEIANLQLITRKLVKRGKMIISFKFSEIYFQPTYLSVDDIA
jgi:hypothetical protein